MINTENNYQMCSRGVWDTTVPGISFDDKGVSNYAVMFDNLVAAYPRGESGEKEWKKIVEKAKQKGRNNKYNCIIGVSGGTDSCYLLHIAKECGLKPLAVNLDNGWNSDISVKNIKKVTSKLNIDLETYVIDYEEMKDILRSYIRAGIAWIDIPTDMAIQAALYKIANREKIKYIFVGNDFRTEGKQPLEWTYGDSRQLRYIYSKFGSGKFDTFPYLTFAKMFYLGFIKGIKMYRPFYYIDYQKKTAQIILKEKYEWEYYGGHHHENLYTKFAIAYWLPEKFNIDKRKITLSAQILNYEITKEYALEQLNKPVYFDNQIEQEKEYLLKKLNISKEEFNEIWESPNKYFYDYPSNIKLKKFILKFFKSLISYILPIKLPFSFEIEARKIK